MHGDLIGERSVPHDVFIRSLSHSGEIGAETLGHLHLFIQVDHFLEVVLGAQLCLDALRVEVLVRSVAHTLFIWNK